jgi:hypothetical protein
MLRLPGEIGPNKLAYVTDDERKLLRRREAVKGFPSKKTTTQGIPVLGDSRAAVIAHAKGLGIANVPGAGVGKQEWNRFTQRLNAEKALRTKGGTQDWVKASTPQQNKRSSDFYSSSAGAAHAASLGKPVGFGIRAPAKQESRTHFASTPQPEPEPEAEITQPSSGNVAATSSQNVADISIDPIIDQSKLEQPLLEEIVVLGPNSEVLEERLKNLINTNSPLFRAATTKALQSMNASGLTNSSIAVEAVMNSILAVAIPIAQRDADAFLQQRINNQNASNEFKIRQNEAYYEAFNIRLNGQINQTLRELAERAANWRAVLAERGRIAVTPGMSKEAAENALKLVTPEDF